MESLERIPVRGDTKLSNQDSEILREYFGPVSDVDFTSSSTLSWSGALKASGYSVLLFAILANPWINTLFYKIPHLDNNPIAVFCVKMFIFMFALFIISKIAV